MPNPAIDPARKAEMLRLADIARAADEAPCCPDIARALRLEESTVRKHLKAAGKLGRPAWEPGRVKAEPAPEKAASGPAEADGDTPYEIEGVGENVRYKVACDRLISTPEELLAHLKLDPEKWEVKKWKCVAGQTAMKLNMGQDQAGNKQADETAVKQVFWITAEFAPRKAPPPDPREIVREILDEIASRAPDYAAICKPPKYNPHLLELDLFDVHFGKLAWRAESLHDYDLKIAEKVFREAVEDLLYKARNYEFETILIPIGNDFLHIDGPQNKTSNGTVVDTDGRLKKIQKAGQMALVHLVEEARKHVDSVKIVEVGGNHDGETSWMNARFLWAYFRNQIDVEVDDSPRGRKVFSYGDNLIGLTHGDEIAAKDLPLTFAKEFRREWGDHGTVEVHCGHFHKAKEVTTTPVDTHGGTIVRYLHSLSATDSWHYKKGFIGSRRAAEAFAWSREDGLAARFFAQVRRDCVAAA